ncbi:MAG: hypothetical protein V3R84_01745 [Acidimicrobiia bacterium]
MDVTFEIRSEELVAEGTASQPVTLAQSSIVECLGTTFDEEFLWSATPTGTGVLDFGDLGSVTIEFESVIVASNDAAAWPRLCGEWAGTYAGASGSLTSATGTFTAIFPALHGGETYVVTFDS